MDEGLAMELGHQISRRLLGVLAGAMLCSSLGCAAPLAGALWVIKGTNVEPECTLLAKKKVAVVVRPPATLKFASANASRDLAAEVTKLLKANGKKIEVVDPREIAKWTDTNEWEDPTEIGKALDAELVLAIDLEDFRLYEGQTLYRGRANVSIKVHDIKKDEVIWEKIPPQTIYPVNACVPTTEKQEGLFRREFIGILADDIGRLFYAHDKGDMVARDSTAFK
jgi:hypothetical protein